MKKFILGLVIGVLLACAFFLLVKPMFLDDKDAKEIGIGTFVCSRDIEPGKYVIKVKAGESQNLEEVIVSTFSSGEELTKYSIQGDGETNVTLEEGMIMKIENGNSGIEVGKITIKKVDKIK